MLMVPATVCQVVGADTDRAALRVLGEILRSAGVRHVVSARSGSDLPDTQVTIYVGTAGDNPSVSHALTGLRAEGPEALVSGGYVLAVGQENGHGAVVVAGVDGAGTFYAVQTLRQLLAGARGRPRLREMVVRDWPAVPIRGVIEVFYGSPWSTAERERHFAFEGANKMNTYVYSPKDDPYLRARWRDPYPASELQAIKDLVQRAAAHHVTFTYAVSPGLSICYSSPLDGRHLLDKFQSMWDVGVRTFAILFDDINYLSWSCLEDETAFGTPSPDHAAAAQLHVVNGVVRDFIDTHQGARPLLFVPTEYYDTAPSLYKQVIAAELDRRVVVGWTGEGVVAPRITYTQAATARRVFGNPILVCDNYPVNDYSRNRLLMGPYLGRTPGLADQVAGIIANPMIEERASRVAMCTVADYAWNPPAYDEDPSAAWLAAIRLLGGPAWRALRVFADSNYSSILNSQESPDLVPLISAFWVAHRSGPRQNRLAAARRLDAYFTKMTDAPVKLRSDLHDPNFLSEIAPWLDKLGLYGQAGHLAVAMMLAEQAGSGAAAAANSLALEAVRNKLTAIPEQVATGVMDSFLAEALSQSQTCPAADFRLAPAGPVVVPGHPGRVTETVTGAVTNTGATPLDRVSLNLSTPAGWWATPGGPQQLGSLMSGATASAIWTLHSPAAPRPGSSQLVGWADLRAGPRLGAVLAIATLSIP